MDRSKALIALARRLERAASARDWRAVDRADRELATLMSSLSVRGSPSAAERAALERARRAHEQAREECARELARIGRALAEARDRRDGCLAYAMSSEG
ncbi:MAG: hypothetical protein DIU56_000725 [Pseudomonadota bacterium]|jgi:hypothetical protein|nr:MAG: hypothetical protein DIU56_02795 [Pseudomonadota bacterium]